MNRRNFCRRCLRHYSARGFLMRPVEHRSPGLDCGERIPGLRPWCPRFENQRSVGQPVSWYFMRQQTWASPPLPETRSRCDWHRSCTRRDFQCHRASTSAIGAVLKDSTQLFAFPDSRSFCASIRGTSERGIRCRFAHGCSHLCWRALLAQSWLALSLRQRLARK